MRNFTLKTTLLSLSTALLLSITGCSSSGSDGTTALASAFSGIGLDGILVGSTVCIDVDNSNTCDAGEPSAITDSEGKFNIAETTLTGPLLLVGGVDNSTGQAFTGSLKAPAGSSVVTPLTAAIQSLVESGKSVEDAEANVKAAMGLTNVDVNLTSFDPYNEVSANAQAVLAKQTQLQVLVHSATVTVAGADDSTDVNATMTSVFDAIVENFNGATAVVTLDAITIAAATKTAADTVYADKPAARVAAKVVAQTSAENSVRDADSAQTAILSGTPSQATGNLDAAITKVNTSAETELKAAAVAAKTAADGLTDTKIAEIEALQQAQQEKEAEIAAAKAAQAQAEADLAAAKAAALADATDRAKYEAYLTAEAAAQKAAVEKLAADEAAALSAQLAAAEEIAISAEAAQREAEARAALAQAVAQKAEAELRQAAAEKAETDAKAATDLAAAQAAVTAAEVLAQNAIAQAELNSNNEIAKFIFAQMSNDFNATKVAVADLNSSAVDANITQAQTVYDTTAITLASLQSLVDNNSTDVNQSLIYKDEIQSSATSLGTLLDVIYTLKYDEEIAVAAQIALTVKLTRIQTIENELIAIDTNVTQRFNEFNTTKVDNDILAIEDIATTYSEAQQAADDANLSLEAAGVAYSTVEEQLSVIYSAKNEVLTAKIDANETAALNAQAAADAAVVIFEEQFAILEAKATEIATIRAEAEAIRDAAIAATPPPANTFATVTDLFFLIFENDNPFVGKVVLNNGTIQEFYYDANSSTWLENNATGDLVLNSSGAWVTPDNSSYSIDATTGIITLADGTQKRLDSVLALPGSSFESEFNLNTPADANISFLDGDIAYITSSKDVEQYVLYYKALNYSTGASYATLEDYVNSGLSFAGYQDATGFFHSVSFDVVPSGTTVTAFTAGDNGDLVLDGNLSNIVGSWSVITLPNTSDLAIELTKAAGKEELWGGAEANLMAVYNSEVYLGEHKQATVDFVQELYPPFNESAAIRIIEFFDTNLTIDVNSSVAVDTNTTANSPERTIPEIGSWYEPTAGVHLTFLDDASYYYAVNNPGTNGVIGGIELGWFDVNSTDYSLSNFQTVINSNEGDTLIGSAITYDITSDTLLINNGTTTVTLQRDDGNTSRPEVGTWIAYEPATNDIVILSAHSDGTYISSSLDINASGFVDVGGDIYNAFELGTYSSSGVDTNMTLNIVKNVNTDYDGRFGPPEGDISFDISNYPTIVNPNITFEKVQITAP